ncbi:GNAT family N-acetyltransferase [Actinopolymorpha pittospori]
MRPTTRVAGRADVRGLASVFAQAFHDDPVMAWILPEEHRRTVGLPRLFATMLRHFYLPYGATDLAAQDAARAPLGGAVWTPPGHWQPTRWRGLLAIPGLARATGRRGRAGVMVTEALERAHPHDPHWYLAIVGVNPAAQGTGIGGELIQAGLATCDELGMPAYLEASKAGLVGYYERFGFLVTREITIPGGPSLWAMRREPC